METFPYHARAMISFVLLLAGSLAVAEPNQKESLPYCKLESTTSHKLAAPPMNAGALRNLAKRHHPRGFGPPPSQRDRPGAVWDTTNEFWYEDGGDIFLYVNTDDNYMYHWRFQASDRKVKVVRHGLLECSGG